MIYVGESKSQRLKKNALYILRAWTNHYVPNAFQSKLIRCKHVDKMVLLGSGVPKKTRGYLVETSMSCPVRLSLSSNLSIIQKYFVLTTNQRTVISTIDF